MIPLTVRELRKLIENLPDDTPFELNINGPVNVYDTSLEIVQIPTIYRTHTNQLQLTVEVQPYDES